MLASDAQLEVWGDPIGHSLSPEIHRAAYAHLGFAWQFGRRRVGEQEFDSVLRETRHQLSALAVTMPLKKAAFLASSSHDRAAELTGVVNTLILGEEIRGYNTDVWGLVDALREKGVEHISGLVRVIGAGATAASAVVALVFLGAERFEIRARDRQQAEQLVSLAERLGAQGRVADLDAHGSEASVTISTLPSGARLAEGTIAQLASRGGLLFDVAYGEGPTELASQWHPGQVISGAELLLRQAVRQIRIFATGDRNAELNDEPTMIARMREALVGD